MRRFLLFFLLVAGCDTGGLLIVETFSDETDSAPACDTDAGVNVSTDAPADVCQD